MRAINPIYSYYYLYTFNLSKTKNSGEELVDFHFRKFPKLSYLVTIKKSFPKSEIDASKINHFSLSISEKKDLIRKLLKAMCQRCM